MGERRKWASGGFLSIEKSHVDLNPTRLIFLLFYLQTWNRKREVLRLLSCLGSSGGDFVWSEFGMIRIWNEEILEWGKFWMRRIWNEEKNSMWRLVYPLCLYFFFNIGWLTQKGAADVFGYLVAAWFRFRKVAQLLV